jgi:hypothetical protein
MPVAITYTATDVYGAIHRMLPLFPPSCIMLPYPNLPQETDHRAT